MMSERFTQEAGQWNVAVDWCQGTGKSVGGPKPFRAVVGSC